MSTQRKFATKRQSIVNGLAEKLKTIDGTGKFLSNLNNNVIPRLKFWDEVEDFPAVHINAGSETREYQTSSVKDRFLSVTVRCYVNEEIDTDEGALEPLGVGEILLEIRY